MATSGPKGPFLIDELNSLERPLWPANPSLTLLDLWMPVMDGYQFLAALRRRASWVRIPVVVCSGEPEGEVRDRLGSVAGYCTKGSSPKGLLRLVNAHCLQPSSP